MGLNIQTFSNRSGGSALYKALAHPDAGPLAEALIGRLAAAGPIAVYDPLGQLESVATFYDLGRLDIVDVFVQDVADIGQDRLGRPAKPVTDLAGAPIETLFLAAFDAGRLVDQVRHLLPAGCSVLTLDEMALPADLRTDTRRYLTPINFATNFAFFRDTDAATGPDTAVGAQHTRLVTANYWGGYGAEKPWLACTLFDADGTRLASWQEALGAPNGTLVIDSAEIRRRFDLPAFTGQLFVHAVGIKGHDIVKYALDTYGDDDTVLSCTHDANAWPAEFYAGLPAPAEGERVVLWLQNSHPRPIPAGDVGLRPMGGGDNTAAYLQDPVAPFATRAIDTRDLLPDLAYPGQIEVLAGKHAVRPRYEVVNPAGRRRIAHVNVERVDLTPDPKLPELGPLMGKGHILPAPVLPTTRFRTSALPTPMATDQRFLPLKATVYDASGAEVAARRLGTLARADSDWIDVDALLAEAGSRLASGYGHVELIYDFDPTVEGGMEADGWLHGIFRYEARDDAAHAAETSFGSHMFNTALVYGNEPQSYAGRPPGLTTRLFLRTGPAADGEADARFDAFCQLIYPASTPWHPHSATNLVLFDREGQEIASRLVEIPCGGSHLFRVSETFDWEERRAAGPDAYVLIRDTTCRLFGYHGLMRGEDGFSLDHMFGF
ncbi:MAG: hypothetical protein GVY28_04170 [Alphaproteobacteria bacterium]|jgi:hypothetical protein|nr:hypothetical protein [Alphaproteobacteria bacterium]